MLPSTNIKFEMADDERIPCTFAGFRLFFNSPQPVPLDQYLYVQRTKTIPQDRNHKDLATLRMQLA